MKWQYLLVSYAIAAAFMAGAVWLSWEWHWAIRFPLLAYLGLCSFVFPLSRIPADTVLAYSMVWSPIQFSGLLVWLALALFYVVVWALGVVFAPIGALIRWSGRRLQQGKGAESGDVKPG